MFSVGGSLIHSVDVPGLKRRQCGFTRPKASVRYQPDARDLLEVRDGACVRQRTDSSRNMANAIEYRAAFTIGPRDRPADRQLPGIAFSSSLFELSLLPTESQSCCVDWLGPAVPPSHSRWRAFMKLPRRGGSTTNATTSPACCCSPALISSLFSKATNTISTVSGDACERTNGIATCIASVTLPVESVGSHTGFSRVRRMRRRPRRSNGFVRRRSPSDRRGLD